MTKLSADFFSDRFATMPVMAILRGYSLERTLELCEVAWSLGINLVEIPLQGGGSREALRQSAELGRKNGHLVGAGTIVSVDLARAAADAGASFTVAPGLSLEVASESSTLGLPHLPGVATASDVQKAELAGYRWQKAFPASLLTAAWLTAMAGPFPNVRFVATGGIETSNALGFLTAGAGAVSLGSSFAKANSSEIKALAQTVQ